MQDQTVKGEQTYNLIFGGVCAKSVHPIWPGLSLQAGNIVCCSLAAKFSSEERRVGRESRGNRSKNAKKDMKEQTKKKSDFGRRLCKICAPNLSGTLNRGRKHCMLQFGSEFSLFVPTDSAR